MLLGNRYSGIWEDLGLRFTCMSVIGFLFSSPGRSPERAIVLPSASALARVVSAAAALAKNLTLKFFM